MSTSDTTLVVQDIAYRIKHEKADAYLFAGGMSEGPYIQNRGRSYSLVGIGAALKPEHGSPIIVDYGLDEGSSASEDFPLTILLDKKGGDIRGAFFKGDELLGTLDSFSGFIFAIVASNQQDGKSSYWGIAISNTGVAPASATMTTTGVKEDCEFFISSYLVIKGALS